MSEADDFARLVPETIALSPGDTGRFLAAIDADAIVRAEAERIRLRDRPEMRPELRRIVVAAWASEQYREAMKYLAR